MWGACGCGAAGRLHFVPPPGVVLLFTASGTGRLGQLEGAGLRSTHQALVSGNAGLGYFKGRIQKDKKQTELPDLARAWKLPRAGAEKKRKEARHWLGKVPPSANLGLSLIRESPSRRTSVFTPGLTLERNGGGGFEAHLVLCSAFDFRTGNMCSPNHFPHAKNVSVLTL